MKHTEYNEHRQLALEGLEIAANCGNPEMERYELTRAQIHATLALAAATHANQAPEGPTSSDGNMTLAVRMKDND